MNKIIRNCLRPASVRDALAFANVIRNDALYGSFSFLFNPRTQKWAEHFTFSELNLVGLTPPGRTTIRLLQLRGRRTTSSTPEIALSNCLSHLP
jgi:uncharacterized protein YceH (UPF0502 family)